MLTPSSLQLQIFRKYMEKFVVFTEDEWAIFSGHLHLRSFPKLAKAGNINATIARAANFYGAETMNNFFDSILLEKYAKKKKAMWLGNPKTMHSFTYVPDAGKALYTLANDQQSGNQTWHLPTAPALTGTQFLHLAAEAFNVRPRYMRVNKFLLNTMGLFDNAIHESIEMYYQYQYDYIFSSEKFEKAYQLLPTSYKDGIAFLSKKLKKQPE